MFENQEQLELFPDHRNYKYTIGQKKPSPKKIPPSIRFEKNLNQLKSILNELGVVGPIGIEINCRSYKHSREMAQKVVKNLFTHGLCNETPGYLLQKGRGHISVSLIGEFVSFLIHFTDSSSTLINQNND